MPAARTTMGRTGLAGLAVAAVLAGMPEIPAAATVLAPHRAIYDMKLGVSRPGSGVSAVEGRLVYELTGSACEGYTQNMRFVTRMSTQQGATTTSDLRSRTWEDGAGSKFRFDSNTLRNEKATDSALGEASRASSNGPATIELTKPSKKTITSPSTVSFPVQHSLQLIEAAKAGLTRLRANLYDGSEQGAKIYDTVASIGGPLKPASLQSLAKVAAAQPLDPIPAWPVSISYFEPGSEKTDAVPIYEMSFWFYENGVSRKLKIDYGEFVIEGDLKEIAFLPPNKCDQGQKR